MDKPAIDKRDIDRVAQVIYEELTRTIGKNAVPDIAEIVAWRLAREEMLK